MKILKFGSIGCAGCLTMKPRFAGIEKENPWLQTEFIDGDERPKLLKKWGVEDLPTFIFLNKNGKEIERMGGIIAKGILVKKIKALRKH